MGDTTCRFCATRIEWWRVHKDAAFYFIGDELYARVTCTSQACRDRAGAEIVADQRRAA